MVTFVMPTVIMLTVIMLTVVIMTVVMLTVIMLTIIMMCIVAPGKHRRDGVNLSVYSIPRAMRKNKLAYELLL